MQLTYTCLILSLGRTYKVRPTTRKESLVDTEDTQEETPVMTMGDIKNAIEYAFGQFEEELSARQKHSSSKLDQFLCIIDACAVDTRSLVDYSRNHSDCQLVLQFAANQIDNVVWKMTEYSRKLKEHAEFLASLDEGE